MNKIVKIIRSIFLVVLSLIILFPVLYAIIGAFKSSSEVLVSNSLLPEKWSIESFKYVFTQLNFMRYFMNSVMIVAVAIIGRILVTTMCSYSLSRMEFKAKKWIFTIMIASFFISAGVVGLLPVFMLMLKTLKLNGLLALIITYLPGDVFTILFLYGYLTGINKELDEAASIDGCSFFGIYKKIVFPVLKPAISVVALLTFMGVWNDYLAPLIYTGGSQNLTTLTVAITALKSTGFFGGGGFNIVLASTLLSIVPVLIAYLIANKFFIAGLTSGSLKM